MKKLKRKENDNSKWSDDLHVKLDCECTRSVRQQTDLFSAWLLKHINDDKVEAEVEEYVDFVVSEIIYELLNALKFSEFMMLLFPRITLMYYVL